MRGASLLDAAWAHATERGIDGVPVPATMLRRWLTRKRRSFPSRRVAFASAPGPRSRVPALRRKPLRACLMRFAIRSRCLSDGVELSVCARLDSSPASFFAELAMAADVPREGSQAERITPAVHPSIVEVGEAPCARFRASILARDDDPRANLVRSLRWFVE